MKNIQHTYMYGYYYVIEDGMADSTSYIEVLDYEGFTVYTIPWLVRDQVSSIKYSYLDWGTVSQGLLLVEPRKEKEKSTCRI